MSVTAAELAVKVKWDDSEVKKGTKDTDEHVKGWGGRLSGTMLSLGTAGGQLLAQGITTAVSGAGALIGDSIGLASDVNEAMSKVGELFGPATDSIVTWAEDAATNLGQSKLVAMDAAATMATFGKAAGLAGEDLADFSKENVKMATDFASFFNTTPEDAVAKIGAAFRGETEPIRDFGIMLDATSIKAKAISMGLVQAEIDTLALSKAQEAVEKATRKSNEALTKYGEGSTEYADATRDLEQANAGLSKVMEGQTGELTANQKVLATQALIAEQGSSALGDFGRTSEGLANQQRILSANMENLKITIGNALLPAVLKLTGFFNESVVPAFKILAEKYGPALGEILATIATGVLAFVDALKNGDVTSDGFVGVMERIGDTLHRLLPVIVDVVRNGLSFFADHFDTIKTILITVGPPLLAAVAAFKGFMMAQAAAKAVQAFAVAVKAVGVALMANPIGIAIAAIAALGAAFYVAYTRSEAFRNFINNLAADLKAFWDNLVAVFRSDGLGGAVAYAWDTAKEVFGKFFTWLGEEAAPWLWEKMQELAKLLGEWVIDAAVYLWDNLPGWLNTFAEWYYGEAVPWVAEKMLDIAKQLGEWVVDAVVYLKDNLPKWIGAFTEWVVGTAIPTLIIETAKFAVKMYEWIGDAVKELPGKLLNWIITFNVWAATEAMPALLSFGKNILNWMADGIVGAGTFLYETGQEIINGLISGLWSMAWKLGSAVKDIINENIPGPIQAIMEIASPSRVTYRYGEDIIEGLVLGMSSKEQEANATTTRLMNDFFHNIPLTNRNNPGTVDFGSPAAPGNANFDVTVVMPPGSNGKDVVDALLSYQRTNGAIPIKVRG